MRIKIKVEETNLTEIGAHRFANVRQALKYLRSQQAKASERGGLMYTRDFFNNETWLKLYTNKKTNYRLVLTIY